MDLFSDEENAEFLAVLDCCLVLCSGGLEKLVVSVEGDEGHFAIGSWAVSAPRLQELRIDVDVLGVRFPLRGMPVLQRLNIDAGEWELGDTMELPASLTRL